MAVTKYTEKHLLPNEKLIYAASRHGFCYVFPLFLIIVGTILMVLPIILEGASDIIEKIEGPNVTSQTQSQTMDEISAFVYKYSAFIPEPAMKFLIEANRVRRIIFGFIFTTIGIFSLISAYLKKISTEHTITTKKILIKKGFVQVDESEIPLNNVEGVKVIQTMFDRMINRGKVIVNGIGMEQLEIRKISNPNKFRFEAYSAVDKYGRH